MSANKWIHWSCWMNEKFKQMFDAVMEHQHRAPDNFLKQGVADALLEAKGVFQQNPEVFFTPKFLHKGVFRSCKSSLR